SSGAEVEDAAEWFALRRVNSATPLKHNLANPTVLALQSLRRVNSATPLKPVQTMVDQGTRTIALRRVNSATPLKPGIGAALAHTFLVALRRVNSATPLKPVTA